MFCDKENVNILTALLVAHDVRNVVVCPGSRNAPIIHNLNECPEITCYPVTDERSAGFYALGMAQHLCRPVAVCVTSGSALLNLAPAVAEARYQHQPMVAISADRPAAWIDQLDGQTLQQSDALGHFVCKAVTLPEPSSDEERWFCNRLVNEALIAARQYGGGPVHINVPISEPLYTFPVPTLPHERKIEWWPTCSPQATAFDTLKQHLARASRPMIVIGQLSAGALPPSWISLNSQSAVILQETLSGVDAESHVEEVMTMIEDDARYQPDWILYIGGHIVSKRLKQFLRHARGAEGWRISVDGEVHDTFMQLQYVVECTLRDIPDRLWEGAISPAHQAYCRLWQALTARAKECIEAFTPRYSQMAAVQMFERELDDLPRGQAFVHYANSSSVRLGNLYSHHYNYVNRGVNGIEGSLSTAAGFSLVCDRRVYIVIGDLSFFYDQNALWNERLRGNLRILLLNNGGGGIFSRFDGLKQSAARERLVMGAHHTDAEGLCRSYGLAYRCVHNMEELSRSAMSEFLLMESERPVVLEVFTDVREDAEALAALGVVLAAEWSQTSKNSVSPRGEIQKRAKTVFRPGAKPQKEKKQRFGLGRNSKKSKNSVSPRADRLFE